MNKLIKKDLFRYVGNDCHRLLCRLRLILFTPACRYIFYFRKTQGGGVFKYLWMCVAAHSADKDRNSNPLSNENW